jgi:hypothetical protein
MKSNVGLWIDHRKAVLVFISDNDVENRTITSNVERQPGRINGKRSLAQFERQLIVADDIQERKYDNSLEKFFAGIYKDIKDAESVFIFGPGEAKGELKKYMDRNGSGNIVAGIESVDKMTDHQIIAKVRNYFQHVVTSPSHTG